MSSTRSTELIILSVDEISISSELRLFFRNWADILAEAKGVLRSWDKAATNLSRSSLSSSRRDMNTFCSWMSVLLPTHLSITP